MSGERLPSSILVLIVEDELLIQNVVEDALKDAGFAVAVAHNGEEAIRMLEAPGTEYRVVVTDVNLGRGVNHRMGSRSTCTRTRRRDACCVYDRPRCERLGLQGCPEQRLSPEALCCRTVSCGSYSAS